MYKDQDILGMYLKDVRNVDSLPIRSKKIEDALIKKARGGDKESLDRIVTTNLKYVITVAKQYQNMGVPLTDLISAGNEGLIEAVDKYDSKRGTNFLTCLNQYVRCYIRDELSSNGRIVRLPVSVINDNRKKHKENQLIRNSDIIPLDENEDIYNTLVHKSLNDVYGTLKNDDDTADELINQIMSEYEVFNGVNTDTNSIISNDNDSDIRKMFHLLNENELFVVKKYFGFDCTGIPSFDDIGLEMGLSTERTRQIYRSAIRKFRCYVLENQPI